MATHALPQIEINGNPPKIEGRVCQGFVCQGYRYKGSVESSANVTYIKFDDQWYRLYFEPWLIFWRKSENAPVEWSVPEESWEYPNEDVGKIAGVTGALLLKCDILATVDGCQVSFTFDNGKRIVIEDKKEVANYVVI